MFQHINENILRKDNGITVLEYMLRKEAEFMIFNSIFSKIRYNNTMRKKNLKEITNKNTIKALNEYEKMKKDTVKYKRYPSFTDALKDLDA